MNISVYFCEQLEKVKVDVSKGENWEWLAAISELILVQQMCWFI